MRNQPSNQSRDSRTSHQSNYLREERCSSREESPSLRHKTEIKQESYYEYVPSPRSSQRQARGQDVTGYEKPSLPYYVVPVLYVPQKVLSSEEIRPSSPGQSKNTVNFLMKNKESDEKNVVNVDDIPCIPCEMKRKNQYRTDPEREEAGVNDLDLDQSCTGYINTSYTQSSTSIIEDTSYKNETPPVTRYTQPVYVQCQSKAYKQTQTRKKYNSQVYEKLLKEQRLSNLQNKAEVNQMPKSGLYMYWNPDYNRYERIKKVSPSADEVVDIDCDCSQNVVRRRKEYSVPAMKPANSECYRPNNDYEVQDRYYEVPYSSRAECYEEDVCEDAPSGQQGCSDYLCSEDFNNLQSSTLSCTKPSRTVKKLSSLIGRGYECEIPPNCQLPPEYQVRHVQRFTSEPLENTLGETENLIAERIRRKPKESQTTFNHDVYSTYVASDHPIRDSKSTQTVDPATTNVSTGTQTIRAIRTFETCPPPYIHEICEGAPVVIRQRARENSPSPTVSIFLY